LKPENSRVLFLFAKVLREHGKDAAIKAVAPLGKRPRGVHPAVSAVAKYYGMSLARLLHGGRARCYSRPRQVAMFVLHELHFSYPAIARELRLENHTTCLHGVDVVLNDTGMLRMVAMEILARVDRDAEGRAA
jgi:chromosomal replication initiation ATPase DnaA